MKLASRAADIFPPAREPATPEHCEATCPRCGHRFNAKPAPWAEIEQAGDPREWHRAECECPNCKQLLSLHRTAMTTRWGPRWLMRAEVTS